MKFRIIASILFLIVVAGTFVVLGSNEEVQQQPGFNQEAPQQPQPNGNKQFNF